MLGNYTSSWRVCIPVKSFYSAKHETRISLMQSFSNPSMDTGWDWSSINFATQSRGGFERYTTYPLKRPGLGLEAGLGNHQWYETVPRPRAVHLGHPSLLPLSLAMLDCWLRMNHPDRFRQIFTIGSLPHPEPGGAPGHGARHLPAAHLVYRVATPAAIPVTRRRS